MQIIKNISFIRSHFAQILVERITLQAINPYTTVQCAKNNFTIFNLSTILAIFFFFEIHFYSRIYSSNNCFIFFSKLCSNTRESSCRTQWSALDSQERPFNPDKYDLPIASKGLAWWLCHILADESYFWAFPVVFPVVL